MTRAEGGGSEQGEATWCHLRKPPPPALAFPPSFSRLSSDWPARPSIFLRPDRGRSLSFYRFFSFSFLPLSRASSVHLRAGRAQAPRAERVSSARLGREEKPRLRRIEG